MAIHFTQYLRPNGRRTSVSINRPADIEALADKFIAAGGCFECEELGDGHASLTAVAVEDEDEGSTDIAIKVVPNGPLVPDAVDALVRDAVKWLEARP